MYTLKDLTYKPIIRNVFINWFVIEPLTEYKLNIMNFQGWYQSEQKGSYVKWKSFFPYSVPVSEIIKYHCATLDRVCLVTWWCNLCAAPNGLGILECRKSKLKFRKVG